MCSIGRKINYDVSLTISKEVNEVETLSIGLAGSEALHILVRQTRIRYITRKILNKTRQTNAKYFIETKTN